MESRNGQEDCRYHGQKGGRREIFHVVVFEIDASVSPVFAKTYLANPRM